MAEQTLPLRGVGRGGRARNSRGVWGHGEQKRTVLALSQQVVRVLAGIACFASLLCGESKSKSQHDMQQKNKDDVLLGEPQRSPCNVPTAAAAGVFRRGLCPRLHAFVGPAEQNERTVLGQTAGERHAGKGRAGRHRAVYKNRQSREHKRDHIIPCNGLVGEKDS
eukprot:6212408-Pleurochrysis_carterae.AAC.1